MIAPPAKWAATKTKPMKSAFYYLYASVCYLVFLASFLYLFAFVENLQRILPELQPFMPKSLDFGTSNFTLIAALSIDLVLIAVFSLQHSLMAWPWFKEKWTRITPKPIERSTYILFASIALAVLLLGWQPLKTPLWDVSGAFLGRMLFWLSLAGWGVVLFSTFLIDHFDMFGLRQVFQHSKGVAPKTIAFQKPLFYRVVRHPIYFGLLLAFWAAPVISLGHLIFSLGMTVYIFVGIRYEEKELIKIYGEKYRKYRKNTPMILPFVKWDSTISKHSTENRAIANRKSHLHCNHLINKQIVLYKPKGRQA